MEIQIKEGMKITKPQKVAKVLQLILNGENDLDQDKEHFWVVGLTAASCIKYVELVTLGILNQSVVHPREIFRMAILKSVVALIVGHNHPSGKVAPSDTDKRITEVIASAGDIIGIKLVDHIIIGNNTKRYYSFKEDGFEDNRQT
ncbi:MAG: JAB domain-containing protein [Thermodesulfobacteriota bacterium]